MKATIEECQQAIKNAEPGKGHSDATSKVAIAHGLCAIAYAIRDLALAVKQVTEKRENRE